MIVKYCYLSPEQQAKLLYYETGFEQLHPIPPVHDWMMQQGWDYYQDWNCHKIHDYNTDRTQGYVLEFKDEIMAELFWLRWL